MAIVSEMIGHLDLQTVTEPPLQLPPVPMLDDFVAPNVDTLGCNSIGVRQGEVHLNTPIGVTISEQFLDVGDEVGCQELNSTNAQPLSGKPVVLISQAKVSLSTALNIECGQKPSQLLKQCQPIRVIRRPIVLLPLISTARPSEVIASHRRPEDALDADAGCPSIRPFRDSPTDDRDHFHTYRQDLFGRQQPLWKNKDRPHAIIIVLFSDKYLRKVLRDSRTKLSFQLGPVQVLAHCPFSNTVDSILAVCPLLIIFLRWL